MSKFEGVEKIGLRDKDTKKIIVVYPYKPEGTDAEIDKAVRDWYYSQHCAAEEKMRNAYVDLLTEDEIKAYK
ncbi:MAG: hypothetical protein ACYDEX_14420 [Mobilitalea sp.]